MRIVGGYGREPLRNATTGLALLFAPLLIFGRVAQADVPMDRVPNSLSLPSTYPESWMLVNELHADRTISAYDIIDVAADTKEFKGQFQGAFYPSLIEAASSSHLYVAESYFEKGGHGKRTDVLTILDRSQLAEVATIVLPGQKRAMMEGVRMDITRDGAFMMILNFTPASSATVVDLHGHRVVNEIPIPGCTSIYPTGPRGFSSLCENGTLTTFVLSDKGQVAHEHRSEPFNDIDNDVLYVNPASNNSTAYFVTQKGNVRPVEISDENPSVQAAWPLTTSEEASDGWRTFPAGSHLALDQRGRLYVELFRETGYAANVGHNTEVWVFDVHSQKRIGRIPLKNGAASIDVTRGNKPYLVAVAGDGPDAGASLDVYDASTAEFVRTIGGWWPGTGLVLAQSRR